MILSLRFAITNGMRQFPLHLSAKLMYEFGIGIPHNTTQAHFDIKFHNPVVWTSYSKAMACDGTELDWTPFNKAI